MIQNQNFNFKIFACFTKSYDEHHDSGLHLIASTLVVTDDMKLDTPYPDMMFSIYHAVSDNRTRTRIVEVFNSEDDIHNFDNVDSFGFNVRQERK